MDRFNQIIFRRASTDEIEDAARLAGIAMSPEELRQFRIYSNQNFPTDNLANLGQAYMQHYNSIQAVLSQAASNVAMTPEELRQRHRLDVQMRLLNSEDEDIILAARILQQIANPMQRQHLANLIPQVTRELNDYGRDIEAWQTRIANNPDQPSLLYQPPERSTNYRNQLEALVLELEPTFNEVMERQITTTYDRAIELLGYDPNRRESPLLLYVNAQISRVRETGDLTVLPRIISDLEHALNFIQRYNQANQQEQEALRNGLQGQRDLDEAILAIITPPPANRERILPRRVRDYAANRSNVINVGAKWLGVTSIQETCINTPAKSIYIPPDGHCYFKVIRKALEYLQYTFSHLHNFYEHLLARFDTMNLAGARQDDLCIKRARDRAYDALVDCLTSCPKYNARDPKTQCSKECHQRKVVQFYSMPPLGLGLPSEYHVYYQDNSVHMEIVDHSNIPPIADRNHFLITGLLQMNTDYYHAALFRIPILQGNGKARYSGRNSPLTKEDISVTLTQNYNLNAASTKIELTKPKPRQNLALVYDIETYTSTTGLVNLITGATMKKELIPFAAGYMLVDLITYTPLYDTYRLVTVNTKKDNLFTILFNAWTADPNIPNKIQTYAHNGNRFDNLFIKKCPTVKFISQIGSSSKLKSLTVSHTDGNNTKTYTFKDTLPFVLQSLKSACKTFKTEHQKLDFDIVDWSFEQYVQHFNSTDPKTNWKEYLKYDVLCLGEVLAKAEDLFFNTFGVSTSWTTGIPGIAWGNIEANCYGIRELSVPITQSLISFYRESCYGGRVLTWKRHYKAPQNPIAMLMEGVYKFYCEGIDISDTYGMMSIDMNSLYPAAMSMCSFPIGFPILFPDNISFEDLNKFAHYVGEFIIQIPNTQYPFHPYRTSQGNVIYPSNVTIQGVYNDVDIREMLKDGCQVLKVIRGVYFKEGFRLFKYLVETLYKLRLFHGSKTTLGYCLKIIINSQFGKMLETIRTTISFSDKPSHHGVCKLLPNGQYETSSSLKKVKVRKPIHIGGYITAHSRAICNEIIRTALPENIYYSDTDSFYIEKKVLKERNMNIGFELGEFKSDYGDKTIIEATFLDSKRHMLKMAQAVPLKAKTDTDPGNDTPVIKNSVKAKFNGLGFTSTKFMAPHLTQVIQFSYKDISEELLPPESILYKQQEALLDKIFNHLLEHYSSRVQGMRFYNVNSLLQYSEFIPPEKESEYRRNAANYTEWEKQQINLMMFFVEKWTKADGQVYIIHQQMQFQIDPHKRGHWVANSDNLLQDTFYGIGCNPNAPIFHIRQTPFFNSTCNYIGYYKINQEQVKVLVHRLSHKRKCARDGFGNLLTKATTCTRPGPHKCDGNCHRLTPDMNRLKLSRPPTYDSKITPELLRHSEKNLSGLGLKSNSITLIREVLNPDNIENLVQRMHTNFFLATYTTPQGVPKQEIVELNPNNKIRNGDKEYYVGLTVVPTGKIPFYYPGDNIIPPGYLVQEILACDVNQVKNVLGENTPHPDDLQEIVSFCNSLSLWFDHSYSKPNPEANRFQYVVKPPPNPTQDLWKNYSIN